LTAFASTTRDFASFSRLAETADGEDGRGHLHGGWPVIEEMLVMEEMTAMVGDGGDGRGGQ
jgi:hypothetical protein